MRSIIVDASDGSNKTLVEDFWISTTPYGPVSQASLTANVICRVIFTMLSNLLMWVPLKLLHRNGELAAVIFIVATMIYNLSTSINSLVWHTDDTSTWWMGWGYCDVYIYINYPILTIYTSCVFAIMRNLADQISLMRADSLSLREKRRRNIIQSIIIFLVPLIQLAWIYPTSVHRYYVMTLVGCAWWPSRTWVSFLFFCVPPPVFALGAAWYAVMTFWRFRQISKDTMSVLSTANSRAASRARRAKRRLYFMTLAILIPYLPVCILVFINNMHYLLPFQPYDFGAARRGELDGYPWSAIVLLPTQALDFPTLNDRYIAVLTAIPVFGFFGMSKDAINVYRGYLVALGLGRIWPVLRKEYDPDSQVGSSATAGILTSSETTQSFAKSISVTHAQSATTPLPPPTPRPGLLRRFKFFPFLTKTHGNDAVSSRAHILAPEELEMRPTTLERSVPAYMHGNGHGAGARVETRVWSRHEEAGEGPSR